MPLSDALDRPLRSLRISVTDRCNLRCRYCMPEREYAWLPHAEILRFEEVAALVDVFVGLGVDKVRLTGGEPLLRSGLPELVGLLAARRGIRDLALTTNGVLLAEQAQALLAAGLHRATVSLDTLRPATFRELTGMNAHARVLEGIAELRRLGARDLKIDTVVMRGVNDDELMPLLEYGRGMGAEVRFIEYMDVGGATRWSIDSVVSRREILEVLERHYGPVTPVVEETAAPADRFTLPDRTVLGIISSTTAPFCRSCDRSRLTADGVWYLCLYAGGGTDLRGPLRAGAAAEEIRSLIASTWQARTDRGAETRLQVARRAPSVPLTALRQDPHLEMHTRGG